MKNRTRLNNRKMTAIVILLCVIVISTVAGTLFGAGGATESADTQPEAAPAETTDTAGSPDTEEPAETAGYELRPDGTVVVSDGTEKGFQPQSTWVLIVMMICVAVTAVVLLVPIKRDKKKQ